MYVWVCVCIQEKASMTFKWWLSKPSLNNIDSSVVIFIYFKEYAHTHTNIYIYIWYSCINKWFKKIKKKKIIFKIFLKYWIEWIASAVFYALNFVCFVLFWNSRFCRCPRFNTHRNGKMEHKIYSELTSL